MKNVFIIGAEHHLFQVNIAIKQFNLRENEIILFIENLVYNHDFIARITKEHPYGEVIIFDTWTIKNIIKNSSLHKAFIQLCKRFVNEKITFFASHYSNDSTLIFNAIVKPEKFYLMDEGTASYVVLLQRNTLELDAKIRFFIKSLLYGIYLSLPKHLCYFTQYDFELPKKDSKLLYEVDKIQNPLSTINEEQLMYIGSSIVELQMIDEEVYLNLLQKIIEDNTAKISSFIYFPHRKETKHKLQKIEKLGFNILYLSEPVETYISSQTSLASIICSLHTTNVLYNISKSNTAVPKLVVYKFDNKFLHNSHEIFDILFTLVEHNKNIFVRNI